MFTVPMAIIDFIPVLFFGATGHLLRKNLCERGSRSAYTLLCTGTIDVFLAGALKALYKLLYALQICDFRVLQQMLMPLQALGFLMAGIGIVCIVRGPQKKRVTLYSAAVPVLYTGVFAFVILMILGLASINASLVMLAKKMKKPAAIGLFVVSFILSLVMGGLSSSDLTQNSVNWIAESVNTISQISLFLGVLMLDRAGLRRHLSLQTL